MNETCFEAINSNVFHHRTKSFHSSCSFKNVGYNMTKPVTWLTAQNLPKLIILIADLVKIQRLLIPFTFLFFEYLDLLNRLYTYADQSLYLVCFVMCWLLLSWFYR